MVQYKIYNLCQGIAFYLWMISINYWPHTRGSIINPRRMLCRKTCQAPKAYALKGAIFLQITAGRRKMGRGIANPVPVIAKNTAPAIK